jgi:hypothetical protein
MTLEEKFRLDHANGGWREIHRSLSSKSEKHCFIAGANCFAYAGWGFNLETYKEKLQNTPRRVVLSGRNIGPKIYDFYVKFLEVDLAKVPQ